MKFFYFINRKVHRREYRNKTLKISCAFSLDNM